MNDDDWAKLARKMGEVSSAPMFIDDSPEHDDDGDPGQGPPAQAAPRPASSIVIDYMQLMSSGKKVESRQLEVSEFSRQIKLLAKELELPDHRALPAQPWSRAARRQAPDDERPA